MNVKFGGEEHQAAIRKVLKETQAAGKKAAIFCTSGKQAKQYLADGFDMVSICEDTASLVAEISRQVADVQ